MAAPGDRRGCVADPPLFESPAAAAGGAGCIVFGGVCQDLQLAEYVHGLPGGAPARMPGRPLNIVHHAEYLSRQRSHAHQRKKEAPSSHHKPSYRTNVLSMP